MSTTSRRAIGPLAILALAALLGLPGCKEEDGDSEPPDDSAALIGDGAVRTLCGKQCYADCNRLVECGRYPGEPGGPGYAECVSACIAARACSSMTFDGLCPVEVYGTGRVITESEQTRCENDARTADCWCTAPQDCFEGGGLSVPISCTAGGLCDPR